MSQADFMAPNILSEQHPREQGLKHLLSIGDNTPKLLSEQHPREQGLKLKYAGISISCSLILSEQHPREQGLKLHAHIATLSTKPLSEQHVNGGVTLCTFGGLKVYTPLHHGPSPPSRSRSPSPRQRYTEPVPHGGRTLLTPRRPHPS